MSESFFETLKRELVDDQVFDTREQARRAIFEYIEVYYNRKRLHSTPGFYLKRVQKKIGADQH